VFDGQQRSSGNSSKQHNVPAMIHQQHKKNPKNQDKFITTPKPSHIRTAFSLQRWNDRCVRIRTLGASQQQRALRSKQRHVRRRKEGLFCSSLNKTVQSDKEIVVKLIAELPERSFARQITTNKRKHSGTFLLLLFLDDDDDEDEDDDG
jgi:hypothetical protein